jgi:hypothetical protein
MLALNAINQHVESICCVEITDNMFKTKKIGRDNNKGAMAPAWVKKKEKLQ